MMDSLVVAGCIGLFLGGFMSLIFGVYSKPTADKYAREMFGMTSMHLIKYISVLILSFSIILAAGVSFLIRDLEYPTQHPTLFTIETLYSAFVPASVLLLMNFLREKPFTQTTVFEYILFAIKFGLAHILLQFSGVYGAVFKL